MNLNRLKQSLDNYLNRKTIFSIFLVIVFLIFLDQLKHFYDELIVEPFLSKVNCSPRITTTLLIAILISFIIFYNALRVNKKVSNWAFFIVLFCFSIFIYYRYSGDYLFSPYQQRGIKYLDFLIILFAIIAILKIKNWLVKEIPPKYFQDPFLIDIPLKYSSKDTYNRKAFAAKLAIKLQSKLEQTDSGSLAIGINGEWGSGKTSFCYFVKEELKNENRIIIDFNPWRSSSSQKIIEDFFEVLISEIRRFDPSLSSQIRNYAKTLTNISENAITKGVESISDFIFEGLNNSVDYERINQSIKKSKKQIIVFIDDLDRLDKREIIETLRLIRNTANFNGVVYIVSYDKEYILEAVKKFNKHNYRSFLEKIFQFEFLLPKYDSGILRNEIKSILNEKLGATYSAEIDAAVDYAGVSGRNISSRVVSTQRDVIRFTNSFLFEIKGLINEVNLVDFYFVQLLRVKFPSIYKILADYTDLFFIRDKNILRLRKNSEKNLNDNHLGMFGILNNSKEQETQNKNENTLFEEFLLKNTAYNYSEIEKDAISDIVKDLVKEKPVKGKPSSKDYRSFIYASNFHKYFSIQLLQSDFSSRDFDAARLGGFDTYKNNVNKWLDEGHISDILEILEKIRDFDSKDEWENHLKILVYIGKYQLKKSGQYGINYVQIIETLNYPMPQQNFGSRPNQENQFFETENDYLNYLKQFFAEAPDPYVFESSLLTSALTRYASLNLPQEDINNQLIDYFQKYCAHHPEVTDDFRSLHRNAVQKKNGYQDEYEYLPGVQELFVNHFLKYLTGKQLAGWIKHVKSESDLFKIDYDWLKTFFDEPVYENLETYLRVSENIKIEKDHYGEFLEFYHLFKDNDFQPVEFVFEYLEPSLWTGGTKSKSAK